MSDKPGAIGTILVGWRDPSGKTRFDSDPSESLQCIYVDKTSIYLVRQTKKGRYFFLVASISGTLAALITAFKLEENLGFKITFWFLATLCGAFGWAWLISIFRRKNLGSRSELDESLLDGSAIRLDVTHIQKIVPPKWKHPLKRMPAEIHFLDKIMVLGILKRQFKKMLPFLPSDRLDETK